MQFSEAMQTEGDYMFDAFVAGITFLSYFLQKTKSKVSLFPFGLIIACSKTAYFFDRENSMNFPELNVVLSYAKNTV